MTRGFEVKSYLLCCRTYEYSYILLNMKNGEYIFYADESGDHSLVSIDKAYPVFVLSICGFKQLDYCQKIVPRFQSFKFRHFGHDMAVLHERDIRKQTGDFSFLSDMIVRERFLDELTQLVSESRFKIFPSIIDKRQLRGDFFPDNPYRMALRICLQHIYKYLKSKKLFGQQCYFVFEKRGDREDKDLELEFRRIVDGENRFRVVFEGFKIRFADKKCNSTGMQLADLTARPIGLNYLKPDQENRAYDAIKSKLFKTGRTLAKGVSILDN